MPKNRFMTKLAIAVGATAFAAPAAAETSMRLHHWLPPQAMVAADIIEPWTERVEKASDGAIDITIYPSLQLGGSPQQMPDQVKNGVVDLAVALPGYTPGRFPRIEVFELPTVYNGDPMSTGLAMADMKKTLAPDFDGVMPVIQGVHSGNAMHCRDTAIRSLDDFKGLKIRTPSRTGQFMLEILGAIPVGMPVTQVPEALSRGVIDCAALPWEIAGSFKVEEIATHHTVLEGDRRFGTAVIFVLMNQSVYENLPEAERAVVDSTIGIASAKPAAQSWIQGENPGREAALSRGNEVIELSLEETEKFLEMMEPIEATWSEIVAKVGVDGPALIEKAKASIASHAKSQ